MQASFRKNIVLKKGGIGMKHLFLGLIAVMVLSMSCVATNVEPQKTQLQIREFQTRTYDVESEIMVLKAVANVLQDEGFIITNAESDLGLLTAQKEASIEDGTEKFFAILFAGANARYKKNQIIDSTANVSQFGKQVKVRMNFQLKAYDNRGDLITLGQIEDELFYQDFFAKVDKGIFIQKENI
jgi:hypothetical protein